MSNLQENIWLIRLRWCALMLGTISFYKNPSPTLIFCGFVLLATNLLAKKIIEKNYISSLFVIDIILLTIVLWLSGGPSNPFSVLYLVHITLTAAVLGAKWTWLIAFLSIACFGSLFAISHDSHIQHHSFSDHLRGMWLAFALASCLIAYFVNKILNTLKIKDKELSVMQLEIEKNSRFASLVTLAAGAAHELGTPLSTIALISSELSKSDNSLIKEDLDILDSEVRRCKKILEDMRIQADFASPEEWQYIDHKILKSSFDCHVDLSKLPNPCKMPYKNLSKVLAALINNSRDAKASEITIAGYQDNECLYLSVADNGSGMSKKTLEKATEPFFTTKPTGKGMGLGLFLARIFCEQLGGNIDIQTSTQNGTTVTLCLPNQKDLKAA